MDEKLKELNARYDANAAELKTLLAKQGITAEDVAKIQELNTSLDADAKELEGLAKVRKIGEQHNARERDLSRPQTNLPIEAGGAKFLGFTPAGENTYEDLGRKVRAEHFGQGLVEQHQWEVIQTDEYKKAFHQYLRKGWHGLANVDQKALSEGSDTAGGFLVPDDIMNAVIMKAPTPTRIRNYVTPWTTSRDALTIPKVVYATDDLYTTGIRATFTGEVPASATSHRVTDPVFGQIRVPVYTAMLSIAVTRDLIEDSAVPVLPWLESRFAETIELLDDNMILNGTGVAQPFGILANPGGTDQPAVVNMNNPIDAVGIVGLGMSLPEQYDEMGRFVFNKTSVGSRIAQLVDSEGRFLWGFGNQDSGISPPLRNRTILGYPVNFSGFMPNVGANNYNVIFGDFRGYSLVRRVGFSIEVLRELYAETNQTLILGRYRFGGVVAEPWRLKIGRQA